MTESETAESKMAEYNLLFREIVDTILFGDKNFSRQTNLGKKKFWTNVFFRDNQFSKDKNYFQDKDYSRDQYFRGNFYSSSKQTIFSGQILRAKIIYRTKFSGQKFLGDKDFFRTIFFFRLCQMSAMTDDGHKLHQCGCLQKRLCKCSNLVEKLN